MKKLVFLFIFAWPVFASCQTKPQTNHPTKMSTQDHPGNIESQHANNPYYSRTDTTKLSVPDSEWKKILPPDVYAVARQAGTERAFTGK